MSLNDICECGHSIDVHDLGDCQAYRWENTDKECECDTYCAISWKTARCEDCGRLYNPREGQCHTEYCVRLRERIHQLDEYATEKAEDIMRIEPDYLDGVK